MSKKGMEQNKDEMGKTDLLYILRSVFWFILVLALGFLAINQAFNFFYGVHFLKAPCDLCGELNPAVSDCIEELNQGIRQMPLPSFYNGSGYNDPYAKKQLNINISFP